MICAPVIEIGKEQIVHAFAYLDTTEVPVNVRLVQDLLRRLEISKNWETYFKALIRL